MDTLIDLITKFGLPIALLAVLLWALWRVILWARDNVALPVVTNHLRFLHKVEDTQDAQQKSLEKLTDLHGQQAEIMNRQAGTLDTISKALDSLACRNGKPKHLAAGK